MQKASSPHPPRDDRILIVNRIFHLALAAVVFPFFYGLTFFPENTDSNFAWSLRPTMSAFWFASLYLTVVYAFIRAGLAKKWHHMALVMWTTIPVLAALGVTTLLHWDKFPKGMLIFYVWLTVYIIAPLPLTWLAPANGRRGTRTPDPGDVVVPLNVRMTSLAISLIFLLTGAGLLFLPWVMIDIWPWKISLLSSRAVGCLFLAPTVAHVVGLFETRWSAFRLVTQAAILWFVAVLVSVVRAWPEFDKSRPATWVFVLFVVLEIAFTVHTYRRMEQMRKQGKQSSK